MSAPGLTLRLMPAMEADSLSENHNRRNGCGFSIARLVAFHNSKGARLSRHPEKPQDLPALAVTAAKIQVRAVPEPALARILSALWHLPNFSSNLTLNTMQGRIIQ